MIKHYIRQERRVEGMRWGPSWADMKEAAKWLGEAGVVFEFDHDAFFGDEDTLGLPQLVLFDRRWDRYQVRVGDILMLLGKGRVVPVGPDELKADYEEVASS